MRDRRRSRFRGNVGSRSPFVPTKAMHCETDGVRVSAETWAFAITFIAPTWADASRGTSLAPTWADHAAHRVRVSAETWPSRSPFAPTRAMHCETDGVRVSAETWALAIASAVRAHAHARDERSLHRQRELSANPANASPAISLLPTVTSDEIRRALARRLERTRSARCAPDRETIRMPKIKRCSARDQHPYRKPPARTARPNRPLEPPLEPSLQPPLRRRA